MMLLFAFELAVHISNDVWQFVTLFAIVIIISSFLFA